MDSSGRTIHVVHNNKLISTLKCVCVLHLVFIVSDTGFHMHFAFVILNYRFEFHILLDFMDRRERRIFAFFANISY